MKKTIVKLFILTLSTLLFVSCGTSRKYGCPSQAKTNAHQIQNVG